MILYKLHQPLLNQRGSDKEAGNSTASRFASKGTLAFTQTAFVLSTAPLTPADANALYFFTEGSPSDGFPAFANEAA